MPRAVEWTPRAERDIERLDHVTRERIRTAIYRLADTGHGDVKRLRGSTECRWRVGDWRVRFEVSRTTGAIAALRVLPRASAYR